MDLEEKTTSKSPVIEQKRDGKVVSASLVLVDWGWLRNTDLY